MPQKEMFGNAKIIVSGHDLDRGYRQGYRRYQTDYPAEELPTDTAITEFLTFGAERTSGSRKFRAGYALGWCAALLTNVLFLALPTASREEREP